MATRTPARRQEKRPAYARITEAMRRSIAAGRLPPGMVLLEGPLAEMFGSSRSPVKQALARLESEGMVERFTGRGMLVRGGAHPLRIELTREHLLLDGETENEESQRAVDAAFYEVEREILQRSLFGRFRVNELALARHVEVGRAEARDLLRRVEQSGIVQKEESSWWTIPFDVKRLRDLYEIRELLEPVALNHAAEHLPPELIATIEGRLMRASELFPFLTTVQLDELETDIHQTCLGYCPNKDLVGSLARTRASLISGKHIQSILMGAEGTDAFLDEHLAVVAALRAGDPAGAAATLKHHLVASRIKGVHRFEEYHRRFSAPTVAYIFD